MVLTAEHTFFLAVQVLETIGSCNATDSDEVIFEVTAGVGGQEAMLFAGELFAMYEAFVRRHGWAWDVLSHDTTDLGSLHTIPVDIITGYIFLNRSTVLVGT